MLGGLCPINIIYLVLLITNNKSHKHHLFGFTNNKQQITYASILFGLYFTITNIYQ